LSYQNIFKVVVVYIYIPQTYILLEKKSYMSFELLCTNFEHLSMSESILTYKVYLISLSC